jgi:hypothetical protein
MAVSGSQQITHLLLGWGQGDQTALEALMPLVYDELRKVAVASPARLQALNARQAQVVELRYFGGLSEEETSEAPSAVHRSWPFPPMDDGFCTRR